MRVTVGNLPYLALAFVALSVSAAVVIQQVIAVESASDTPPATFAEGSEGSTLLGASATSADTDLASDPILGTFDADVLRITPGGVDVNVQVELVSETGVLGDSLTVELDDGTTSEVQVDILDGVPLQSVGTALGLDAGGPDLTIHVTGTEALLSSDTLYSLQVIITPQSGAGSEARYDYDLTVR